MTLLTLFHIFAIVPSLLIVLLKFSNDAIVAFLISYLNLTFRFLYAEMFKFKFYLIFLFSNCEGFANLDSAKELESDLLLHRP